MKLDAGRAALVVIDLQEAFAKVIPGFDRIAAGAAALARGAAALGMPVVATEQYPKGLGRTVPEVADALPGGLRPVEKVCFAASQAEGFDLGGREQAILCGVEAHVCVSQTALDLLERGVEVHVARDAVGSRFEENRAAGLERMERAGAVATTVEMALFELVGGAGTEEFKQVQRLVLEYAPNP